MVFNNSIIRCHTTLMAYTDLLIFMTNWAVWPCIMYDPWTTNSTVNTSCRCGRWRPYIDVRHELLDTAKPTYWLAHLHIKSIAYLYAEGGAVCWLQTLLFVTPPQSRDRECRMEPQRCVYNVHLFDKGWALKPINFNINIDHLLHLG